jgi:DNA recombination protein RmuC
MSINELIILIILIGSFFGLIVFFISSQLKVLKSELKSTDPSALIDEKLKQLKESLDKNTTSAEKQLREQRDTLESQLKRQEASIRETTKLIWERLDKSTDVIRDVQKQLGGIEEFGKDMKDFSSILKSPKLRGGLGEQFLYEILANTLPHDMYKTQYKFRDGNICDAVILTDKGIIPIDSKFPMENFKAMSTCETPDGRERFRKSFIGDVKKRIDEIATKYILPAEKTTEQAVMYVPSENVWYELIINTPEIEDYARRKNVVMVSPNTFSYSLKVLLVAYQQHELAKHATEILKSLSSIKIEAEKFNEDLGVMERHVSNSYKAMDNVKNRFGKLFGKIEGAASIEGPEGETTKRLLEEGITLDK